MGGVNFVRTEQRFPPALPGFPPNESALRRELGEDFVCLLQGLLAADVVPGARDLIRLHRAARVEPLNETSGLIRIVSGRDVGGEQLEGFRSEIIEGNARKRALRLLWL